MPFLKTLGSSSKITGTCACMGIDPVVSALPLGDKIHTEERIVEFFRSIFDVMLQRDIIPAAFKPNIGFFHILDRPLEGDFSGSRALAAVVKMIRERFPDIPLIIDAKMGDIANSSLNYAGEAFDSWGGDGVTVHPYMGDDSVEPFLKKAQESGGGVYVLNRTSNSGAERFQNLNVQNQLSLQNPSVHSGGRGESTPLYMETARAIAEWAARYPGTGAVVGATSLSEFEHIVEYYSRHPVPLLIPGVGSQGGSAEEVLALLRRYRYPLDLVRINSSSGVTHPWKRKGEKAPENWARECVESLSTLIESCAVRENIFPRREKDEREKGR
ncbi:MAG: orotidine-5'-phosphate decarboxylase [Spirochaetia bacterium]